VIGGRLVERAVAPDAVDRLVAAGVEPWYARILAARGISDAGEIEPGFDRLPSFDGLSEATDMARLLADAIARGDRLLIVADYDADGATACAVGIRALRAFGARVDFLVPDRFRFGYGLTPEIVRIAAEREPAMLITVDNGISSIDGVAEANRLGIPVLVTDHHLPGPTLPAARCIVNPNKPGCGFPSKHLAGVGVMFYVMLALRAELRARGAFATQPEPRLANLLDIVALGTVADVVRLDGVNRLLVAQGMQRIRAGKACAGIGALYRVSGRDPARSATWDLGYALGPRLNAAGRLEDMSLGIECLVTDDEARAADIATRLDALNRERRAIETGMKETAFARLDALDPGERYGITMYEPDWHPGVIGILAARIKDRFHRPAIAFAGAEGGELKGSGRSVPALHLRDAIERVETEHPGLVVRFGGHAAAAGLSIRQSDFERFSRAFESVLRARLGPADLEREIATDGELDSGAVSLETARRIAAGVWGQGFPEPQWCGEFDVIDQRVVGGHHSKLRLAVGGRAVTAMLFGSADPLPARIRAVYRVTVNHFRGEDDLNLVLAHWAPASGAAERPGVV
jgi:single-stranded-DNA-specific exonuclease